MNAEKLQLSEELILMNIDAQDAASAIEKVAMHLYEKGCVKESYIQAVKARENTYPTGLPTAGVGVAIPHTDVEHVNTPAVAVALLNRPVTFNMMGMSEVEVEVQLIFMLAIKEPQAQLKMLQDLMGVLQNEKLLLEIKNAKSKIEIIQRIKDVLE